MKLLNSMLAMLLPLASVAAAATPVPPKDSGSFSTYLQNRVLELGRPATQKVPETCAAVPAKITGKTYYFQPYVGKLTNDGSSQKPFPDLATFMANAKSRALLKGGDELVLRAGDHGIVNIPKLGNTDFITIRAETPKISAIIQTLFVNDGSKLIFKDLSFTPYRQTARVSYLVMVRKNVSDVVFTGNRFYNTYDTTKWTDKDWVDKSSAGMFAQSTCTTVVGNTFFNLGGGMRAAGDKQLVSGNFFHDIMNDNIAFQGSDLNIHHNVIANGRNNLLNTLHADSMQAYFEEGKAYKNVTIDSNFITHYQLSTPAGTNIKAGAGSYRQGVCIFGGDWTNVAVTNNIILTNNTMAIELVGNVKNSRIINNTVLSTDSAVAATEINVWINLSKIESKNVTVRNNITETLRFGDNNKPDNNTVLQAVNNKFATITKVGAFGVQNTLLGKPAATVIRKLDAARKIYDVRLPEKSPLALAGIATDAPALDILGNTRRVVGGKVAPGALSE